MHIRTRVAASALAALAVVGCAAGTAAAQATPHAPGQLTFASQLTAIRFFTASGPITGFPTRPLVPGDRIIGQDRILQDGRAAGHDNEAEKQHVGLRQRATPLLHMLKDSQADGKDVIWEV